MTWTVVRYDADGWPSHPDVDLPEHGAPVELWRRGSDSWCRAEGLIHRHVVDGHQTATMRDVLATYPKPPADMPTDVALNGAVWRPL